MLGQDSPTQEAVSQEESDTSPTVEYAPLVVKGMPASQEGGQNGSAQTGSVNFKQFRSKARQGGFAKAQEIQVEGVIESELTQVQITEREKMVRCHSKLALAAFDVWPVCISLCVLQTTRCQCHSHAHLE
jgi:hypothetical protein